MQLVAYGAQDIYLTGNPQITFFKVVYRRHTNFSMEAIEQTMNGTVAYGGRASATISRNGDLVGRTYFEIDPAAIMLGATDGTAVLTAYMGNCLFKEVTVEIGGQQIDKQYREWMSAWADLTEENDYAGAGVMTSDGKYESGGKVTPSGGEYVYLPGTQWQKMSFNIHGSREGAAGQTCIPSKIHKAFVPLQFWFCRNPGLALPLIALQYHEVKIVVQFATNLEISTATNQTTGLSSSSCKLWCDYIYLDTDERRRFAQVSHEYLIEQLQREQHSTNTSYSLNFNHPVKELIWGKTPSAGASVSSGPAIVSRLGGAGDPYSEGSRVTLKLNGHERFAPRHPNYFNKCQVWQHHTGHGGVIKADSLNVYSFALKPEEHQPSGTCNFSRIDNAQLVFSGSASATGDITIFAVNYNVLRIMSGMGGLAYSN